MKQTALGRTYRKIAFGFTTITVILILIILYFSFNQATIVIKPKKESADVDFTVKIQSAASDQEPDVLVGQVFETTVEGSQKFKATGTKTLETGVSGQVTIINDSAKNQTLVATTRLLTPDQILFRLKRSVTIPARSQKIAEVYADNPNLTQAVGPTRFTIPGLWSGLQDKIYAESSESFSGNQKEMTVVSQGDLDQARKTLTDSLVGQAVDGFKNNLTSKAVSFKIVTTSQELSSQFDAKLDDPKEEFSFNLKLKVGGVAFNNEELSTLAENKLKASLPPLKELSNIDQNSFKYSIQSYDQTNNQAELSVHLAGTMILSPRDTILDKNKLIGLTQRQVEAYLKNFDTIESFQVNFTPFWVYQVPSLKDHIIIKIEKD